MRGFQARQHKSAQSKDKYFLEFLRFFKRVRQYRFNSLHVFDIRFKCKFRSLSNDIPANLKANFQRKEINISLTGALHSLHRTKRKHERNAGRKVCQREDGRLSSVTS